MADLRACRSGMMSISLFAAAYLASQAAFATPLVTDYISVQPIDVCFGPNMTGCAAVNNMGKNVTAGANTRIGFIDSNNVDVTRALWNQIGVDIYYTPVRGTQGPFSLSVDPGSNPPTSADFSKLSDQPQISQKMPPTPTPPLSPDPTVVNMFFVKNLNPATRGTLYGFSWLNNNGISISENALLGASGSPDTIAHEIGHNLDLLHGSLGAGPDASGGCSDQPCKENLMTQGDLRDVPMHTQTAQNILQNGMDQLNAAQQAQMLQSGFLNPIPRVTATVTAPSTGSLTGPFHVSFDQAGRPNEFLSKLILTAPSGTFFQDGTFSTSLNTVTGTILPDGSKLELDFSPHTFTLGSMLDYTVGVCQTGDFEGCMVGRPDLLLEGGTYTFDFETDSEAGIPVEQVETTSDLVVVGGGIADLFSDSQEPDLSFAAMILNPDTFVGFGAFPCTQDANGNCPTPMLEDAIPSEEYGQQVPEPPSLPILFLALAVLPVVRRFTGRARRSFEARLA